MIYGVLAWPRKTSKISGMYLDLLYNGLQVNILTYASKVDGGGSVASPYKMLDVMSMNSLLHIKFQGNANNSGKKCNL